MTTRTVTRHHARPTPHPLGPLLIPTRDGERAHVRCWAIVAVLILGGVLGVAGWLEPSPTGRGTHQQLGLPACHFAYGLPCPTCGMTTAFAYVVRGRLFTALAVQPLGGLLAIATVLGLGVAIRGLLTGRTWRVNWYRVSPARVAGLTAVMVLGAWGYKILTFIGAGG